MATALTINDTGNAYANELSGLIMQGARYIGQVQAVQAGNYLVRKNKKPKK